MKIETLVVIAHLDNGEFHQVVMPEGVSELLLELLKQDGKIKLLPKSLELEMTKPTNKK